MLHNIAYERILRIFAFFGFVAILVLFPFFLIFVAKMRPLDSVVAGMIAATIGGVIIAARGVRRPPTQDSSNETISQYQNQTRQIKDMKWVLLGAIIAGTLLMMIAIVAPYLFIPLIHTYVVAQNTTFSNATIVDTIKTLSNAPKDVLPFATALAGFAGGVVTAMFRVSTAPTTQDTNVPRGRAAPAADNKTVKTTMDNAIDITLTGTPQTAGDKLQFTVVGAPQHGRVAVTSDVATSDIVTYTPQAGFTGSDKFTYKATDPQGVDSNIATVDITVT